MDTVRRPAKYLVDKNGRVRYSHFGEGKYDETEKMIQELLTETGTEINQKIDNPEYEVYGRTPELYLGYSRMEYLASPEGISPDKETEYSAPETIPTNRFAYQGLWTIGKEKSMPTVNSSLILNFEAKEVFLVMNPTDAGPGIVRVVLDGEVVTEFAGEDVKDGVITVDSDRLYKLIMLSTPGEHVLQLDFLDSNTEVFAFTFG